MDGGHTLDLFSDIAERKVNSKNGKFRVRYDHYAQCTQNIPGNVLQSFLNRAKRGQNASFLRFSV